MSGYSTFYCEKCKKEWESLDFNKYCLDCREDEQFSEYVDCIMSMCLSYKTGSINKPTLLNNMKLILPIIEKL